ncbi:MAG: 50S ribosomal protein L10 [Planctomycetes bacterium]|nr:50S ribosomal protein L10 [Planctomycetota bacterium]
MSKKVKQMGIDTLKQTFQGVRDLVMMNVVGLDAVSNNQIRLTLRKKNIRLQMVKNSLAKRVFDDMGMVLDKTWEGSTTLAWGGTSVAELCKELEAQFKKAKEKVKFKGAVADGQPITFEQGLTMPTRQEAIGAVIMLLLSPGRRLAGQIRGPAGRLAGQIKSISEKKDEAAPPAEAPAS